MQKRNKLAAIVNHLSEDELANLSPNAALSLLQALREQARTRETDTATGKPVGEEQSHTTAGLGRPHRRGRFHFCARN